ncbi:MAG: thioredoxin [Lachnospiraceae bacterium]|nr:thioredoxin [Lachnospiraceae bacterium]
MAVTVLTSENFEQEVLKADKPVLVDFWATWCGPCQKQGPVVEALAEAHDDIKVCKLDVDEVGDIAEKYNIMSIPTIYAFKNGEVVNKSVGLASQEQLLALFN